jgi:dienelactone hydrolase
VPDLQRIAHFPTSLLERCTLTTLATAPALLVHPEGDPATPRPYLLWLHGRTVHKEIDTARFQRLSRGGIGVAAIDLPGHGERLDPAYQAPGALSLLLSDGRAELDLVIAALQAVPQVSAERLAIGGMSGGGMIALRRLCEPHPFRCAVVEATAGDFTEAGKSKRYAEVGAAARFRDAQLRGLDPSQHLGGWPPIPLLAFHSETDEVVPVAAMRVFVDALAERYAMLGRTDELELVTFPQTGAPEEHVGFGRLSGEVRAKTVEFLSRHLQG